jgi:hypothetical protein
MPVISAHNSANVQKMVGLLHIGLACSVMQLNLQYAGAV